MNIDWGALGVVSLVTLLGTVFAVCVVSCAALLTDLSHARAQAGRPSPVLRAAAIALVCCCAAILLFGLWVMIPYF